MKRTAIILGFLLLLTGVSCRNDADAIRQSTSRYWKAVIAGDYDTAYQLLTRESRVRYSRAEFEEKVLAGKASVDPELTDIWAKVTDFEVVDVEQRGKQATAGIAIYVPDLQGLRARLADKAQEKNLERRTGGDSTEIEEWFTKQIRKEIRKGRFDETVIDVDTRLMLEGVAWKVVFGDEEQ